MENHESKQKKETCWTDLIKDALHSNLRAMAFETMATTRLKLKSFFQELGEKVARSIVSSMVVFVGVLFMMVGLAKLVNDLTGAPDSIGYITVGVVASLIGVAVKEGGRKKPAADAKK